MLNLDISVVVIALLVWLLMVLLNKIYFKPVGRVINERETKIEKESNQIESMTGEIEEKTQHIETVLKDAKKESTRIKEELIQKGEEVREKIITDARQNSKTLFQSKMKELDGQIAEAEKKLEQEISLFSDKMKEIFIS
ncbi:MAG: ATP synthase F0 subunit B [bacterium]|nr:ATP synthase F0 subunit B [bacterium]